MDGATTASMDGVTAAPGNATGGRSPLPEADQRRRSNGAETKTAGPLAPPFCVARCSRRSVDVERIARLGAAAAVGGAEVGLAAVLLHHHAGQVVRDQHQRSADGLAGRRLVL